MTANASATASWGTSALQGHRPERGAHQGGGRSGPDTLGYPDHQRAQRGHRVLAERGAGGASALDHACGVSQGAGDGQVVRDGIGQVHRAGVGASDVEVGLHRRQRPAGVPQQVAHGPLTEAWGVIVVCRGGADFEEPSGGTIEGMCSWSVDQLSIAAASVQRPYWAPSRHRSACATPMILSGYRAYVPQSVPLPTQGRRNLECVSGTLLECPN